MTFLRLPCTPTLSSMDIHPLVLPYRLYYLYLFKHQFCVLPCLRASCSRMHVTKNASRNTFSSLFYAYHACSMHTPRLSTLFSKLKLLVNGHVLNILHAIPACSPPSRTSNTHQIPLSNTLISPVYTRKPFTFC